MSPLARHAAASLNRDCPCSVDYVPAARADLDAVLGTSPPVAVSHPHLFSDAPVFLGRGDFEQMRSLIRAVETLTHDSRYQDAVLGAAPPLARIDPHAAGVFMGFDFHVTTEGPRLIEINTNAGGAFLGIASRRAQQPCCNLMSPLLDELPSADALEAAILSMFAHEWALAGQERPLRSIAIVDEDPRGQFLYPEFRLAQALFESHGIRAHIAAPAELVIERDALRCHGEAIDLVYNRLTDFHFAAPANATLARAYEAGLAVITPHPRAHALYADKRNLTLLSDAGALAPLGADAESIATLTRCIPATREVAGDADEWWRDRRNWFFKPRSGFGSRGTYRGDKLTKRVFADIMSGGYVAQAVAAPGERRRSMAGVDQSFKVDIRCYVYAGNILSVAARLYQGQTTNFRTMGGGFAPVYVIDAAAPDCP